MTGGHISYGFDGNRYTDMSSQLVNLNLGYGNKAIGDAIIGVKADIADHISSRKLESAFERTIFSGVIIISPF